jgi:recombination DNA repair RAD52 pathway protein
MGKIKQSKQALTLYEKIGIAKKVQPISSEQILFIMQKTPKEHIYTRPAKGGGSWDYVTGVYIEKVLNYVFGFDWDFEIKNHGAEGNQIWVLGRLTVRTLNDKTIIKEQFGRADLKQKRDKTGYLDYGNDLKAAATDALKKCASKLGIASDVYGKNEFKEIKTVEIEELPTPEKTDAKKMTDSKPKTEASLKKHEIKDPTVIRGELLKKEGKL